MVVSAKLIPQCLHHRLQHMWLVIIVTPDLPPPASTSLVPAAKEQQIPVTMTEYQHRYESRYLLRLGMSYIPEPSDCCITQRYIVYHRMRSYIPQGKRLLPGNQAVVHILGGNETGIW